MDKIVLAIALLVVACCGSRAQSFYRRGVAQRDEKRDDSSQLDALTTLGTLLLSTSPGASFHLFRSLRSSVDEYDSSGHFTKRHIPRMLDAHQDDGKLQWSSRDASRRSFALGAIASTLTASVAPSHAIEALTLDDLPTKAAEAYNNQWPLLQLGADYYVFELLDLLEQPGKWSIIAELTQSTSIGSAESVSKAERQFFTPMRILSLTFPPDAGGDELQEAFNTFQSSMSKLARLARAGQTTGNVAAPSPKEMQEIRDVWDVGRRSLNSFFAALNTATSTKRLVAIPEGGKGYPRSKKLYVTLQKNSALCRNRGGETLAGLWGNLMVYSTVGVNPCGDVNLNNYFDQ